jgi:hypothetical protein
LNGTCIVITSQSGQTNRYEADERGELNLRVVDYVEDKQFVRDYMNLYFTAAGKKREEMTPNKLTPPQRLSEKGGFASVSMDHPALKILRERRLKKTERDEL